MSGQTSGQSVTVDAATWQVYQRSLQLLNRICDDPKRGTEFKRLAKEVDPSLRFADLEAADTYAAPLKTELDATRQRLAALEAEREQEKLEREARAQARTLGDEIDGAAKRFGLTDEGRSKMTQRMQEKGSLDAEAAAAWVAAHTPKAKPSESNGAFSAAGLNLFGSSEKEEKWRELHEDPQKWMGKEIETMLAEAPLAAA